VPRFIVSATSAKHQVFELRNGEHIIGRENDASLLLPNVSVSRHHAKLVVRGDDVTLEDLGSGNGTTVNGQTVLQHRLQSKDEVKIGKFTLIYLSDHRADEFFKGRCVRYMPLYESRSAEVTHEDTFVLSKDALRALANQSRLVETARIVLVRDPSKFWHPEDRPLTFGGSTSMVGVNGWFIFGDVAEVAWDQARHVLRKKAWWVPVKVNDAAITEATPLKNNDRVSIGESRFRYEGEK